MADEQGGGGELVAPGRGGRGPGAAPGPDMVLEHWGLPMLALVVGAFMALLDSSIVNVAIPAMERAFGVGTAQMEWVVTIYLLALGVVVPASGWLGDRLGFKRLYLISLLIFTVGSGLSALAPSLGFLIGARVLQAVGGGMIMPTTMSMVYRIIPRRQLGTATSFFGMAMLLAPAVGPTLGGYLVEYVSWRWIFTINLPIGLVGGLLAAATLPDFGRQEAGRFDAAGFLTASTALFTLLLALSEGQSWGWNSEPIIWLFFIAGVALAAFVWIELSIQRPLLDLRVFRYTQYLLSSLFVLGISVALFAAVFFIPVFLQLARGMGALDTGLILMPGALVTGLFMPVGGRLYDRMGPRVPVVVGTCLLVAATFLFHNLSLTTPDTTIAIWSALRGIGMGLAMMPATTAGMSVIPPAEVGRASAVNNILQRLGGSFGIAFLTVLVDRGIAQQSSLAAAMYAPGSAAVYGLQGEIEKLAATGLGQIGAEFVAYTHIDTLIAAASFAHTLDGIFLLLAAIGLATVIPAVMMRGKSIHEETGAARPIGMAAD